MNLAFKNPSGNKWFDDLGMKAIDLSTYNPQVKNGEYISTENVLVKKTWFKSEEIREKF